VLQTKAYILQEPEAQLLKYIDVPAFETGDLFYIQDLVAILENPGSGFKLQVNPSFQSIDTGASAAFTIEIQPTGGFTKSVTLDAPSPSPDLDVHLLTPNITPPGQTTLTLTDLHLPGSLTSGLWYTVPITAASDDFQRSTSLNLLVNGSESYLPLIMHPAY
jgi:hypothetical protein